MTNSIRRVLEQFANQTTMHGIPKVIHSRSTMARCFWSMICITAGAMFCMQMSEVLHRYFSYPKKVTVEVVPTPVPFPAISLCNMRNLDILTLNTINDLFLKDHNPINHMNYTDNPFIPEYMRMLARYSPLWYEYQNKYPLIFQEVFSRTSLSSNIPRDKITQAAIQLNEFMVNCFFGGHYCSFEEDFKQFFDPYYYNCFTYTSRESRESEAVGEIQYSLSEGIENGWSAVVLTGSGMMTKNEELRVLPGLHESKSAVSGSEGVRVVIHPPGTEPFPFTEGYDTPPGFSASFGIRPRLNLRVGQPYGNCTAENPFNTTSEKRYRSISCQKKCLQHHVIQKCGCYDESLPRLENATLDVFPACRNDDDFPDSCMLNGTEECLEILQRVYNRTQCTRRVRDEVTKNTLMMTECRCHPPCDEVDYDVSYSLSKWPAPGLEGDAAYFDVFHIEFFKERFRNTSKYEMYDKYFNQTDRARSMQEFARLNVYIADSNVIKTHETADYEPNQLVSDIGGQLGLWVGISVITLTEVLELCVSIFRYLCSGKLREPKPHLVSTEEPVVRNGKYHSPGIALESSDPFTDFHRNDYSDRALTFSEPVYR